MGSSAREIERQIRETRERMDENIGELETRAASGWRRYGKVAAIVVVAVASAAAGYVVWRRMRQPTLRGRVYALAGRLNRMKKQLPSVKVDVSDQADEPGLLEGIARKVAPAVVGAAATGLVERVARPPQPE